MVKVGKALVVAVCILSSALVMGQVTAYSYNSSAGFPIGLSRDGSTTLLPHGYYTPATGPQAVLTSSTTFDGISDNGFWFAGNGGYSQPVFVSKASQVIQLPPPPETQTYYYNFATTISGNGLALATYNDNYPDGVTSVSYSLAYIQNYGWEVFLGNDSYNAPQVIDDDGQVAAGNFDYNGGRYVWVDNHGSFQFIAYGGLDANATVISRDGSVVWGYYYGYVNGNIQPYGFRWTSSGGFLTIPYFVPTGATDDNFVAVGYSWPNSQASIYTVGGFTNSLYYSQLTSVNGLYAYQLYDPFISGDGTKIALTGYGPAETGFYFVIPGFALSANADSYNLYPNELNTVAKAQGVLANDVNVFSGLAQLTRSPQHAASFNLNTDGSFTYQPVAGYSGPDSFQYQIDRDMTASNPAEVSINVLPPVNICVKERLGLGKVPDGTVVKINNNDGTALSPAQSATTVSGIASFPPLPQPSGSNTSYEIIACVPAGGVGQAAVIHGASAVSQTVYITPVRPIVMQTLTTGAPVAYASVSLISHTSTTGTDGHSGLLWLPDGTYSATATMNPGIPATVSATFGASPSSNLSVNGTYAQLCIKLTRIQLTARTSSGTTYIPKAGSWSISPGSLSFPVNGHATSSPFWLPTGTFTASLSGATLDGSKSISIGAPIAQGVETIVVGSGP